MRLKRAFENRSGRRGIPQVDGVDRSGRSGPSGDFPAVKILLAPGFWLLFLNSAWFLLRRRCASCDSLDVFAKIGVFAFKELG